MANEGELPDLDMKMPSLDLELPEPTLSLDLSDLGLDAPANTPAASPAPKVASPAGKPAEKKAAKQKKVKEKKVKVKSNKPGISLSGGLSSILMAVVLDVLCIVLLFVITAFMYLFDVPVNMVPDLSLTTYVQSLWLIVGCFIVVAMLHDLKLALILTGLDIVMLITIFPTLMLLMDTPMNPLYFFVMGMIVLQFVIAMPLSVISSRKTAAKKSSAPAGTGATSSNPTGPTL